ncbi:MAG TPA: DNA-directed DNA polymerase II small subunit [Candidatus Woesearchaeota archaeon]|nr:DNA-directed DNA polymerase II small subunit [Candidatus Woesearchaeota archaeon]
MKEAIERLTAKGLLASPDLSIEMSFLDEFIDYLETLPVKPFVVGKEHYEEFKKQIQKSGAEPDNFYTEEPEIEVRMPVQRREKIETNVKVKKNYVPVNKKLDIKDWVTYYFDRYNRLSNILQNRHELKGAMSIGRIFKTDGRQQVALIGMVRDINKTFTGLTVIMVEDPTGCVKVILKNEAVAKLAGDLVYDEVLGVVGVKSKDVIFADKLVFPDVPEQPLKKGNTEVSAAFISDVHVGSNMFLPKELTKFVDWLKGKVGTEKQKAEANKVRYLFVTGDLVDGVGIYPGQEKELIIPDIYNQYEEFAKYFVDIPEDIHVIVAPGNHDALRLAEPQHTLFKDIAKSIYDLPNLTSVSNPAMVNIQKTNEFPGFDVLMYHGYSLDYYAANIPSLRATGYDRADLLMNFLLKKRHLAPAHGSTLINPMPHDFLLIDKIPDIFTTAHIHKSKVGRYKNILNIASSCFQGTTSFQEKVGHQPEPARVPIVDLKSNEVKVMRFG